MGVKRLRLRQKAHAKARVRTTKQLDYTEALQWAHEYVWQHGGLPSLSALSTVGAKCCGMSDQGSVYRPLVPTVSFVGAKKLIFGQKTAQVYGVEPGMIFRLYLTQDRKFLQILNVNGVFATETAPQKNAAYHLRPGTLLDFKELAEQTLGTLTKEVEIDFDDDKKRAPVCHFHTPGGYCWRLLAEQPVVLDDGNDRALTLPERFPVLRDKTFPLFFHPDHRNMLVSPVCDARRMNTKHGKIDKDRLHRLVADIPQTVVTDTVEEMLPPWLADA